MARRSYLEGLWNPPIIGLTITLLSIAILANIDGPARQATSKPPLVPTSKLERF
jgi:hypothetical protein